MMDSVKKTTQKLILEEFARAQSSGFITKIDMELEPDGGKIIYDPAAVMYRNNEYAGEKLCKTYTEDLKDVPYFSKLHIYFSELATKESLQKVEKYVAEKYRCKCTIDKTKLSISDFEYGNKTTPKSQ